jgi:hypothetical protein
VIVLRTPVDESVTAHELFEAMRWYVLATGAGKEMAKSDGVSVVGAHVEAPSVLTTELTDATAHIGHVVLALCSVDLRHYVDDVLSNLVYRPTYRLSVRGCTLTWRHGADERDDTSEGSSEECMPRKRRQDDWMELKRSADGLYTYERWQTHQHPKTIGDNVQSGGMSGMMFMPLGAGAKRVVVE